MWDRAVKIVFDVFKILAIVVPTAVSGYAVFNSEVLLKSVSDNLAPAVTAQISEEMPVAVSKALVNTEIQIKLDSTQMNALEIMMMEHQEATLNTIPEEVAKQGRLLETKIFTSKYKIINSKTGEHVENLVGVKQAGGEWFIYVEKIEK